MKRYDLHTHSNYSDGSLAPAEVVRVAREAGLDGIALTDHDGTGGIEEAQAAGRTLNVEVLLGCEVSAGWNKGPVHVLAYFFDPTYAPLVEELRWIRDDRVVRAEKMVERLQELGVPITFEQVQQIAGEAAVGRPHVAQAMVNAGVVDKTVDAFTPEWIADGGRAYIPKRVMTPHDTVELIRDAGGVSVIAHPVWIERDGRGGADGLIEELAELGLGGIEVNHPDQDDPWRAHWAALADRLDLIETGSSDFHGNEHGPTIGVYTSSEQTVDALRARCGAVAHDAPVRASERGQAG
jgi:hypothetical protein